MSPFEIPLQGSFKRQIILTFVVGFFFLIASFATYLVTTERDNLHRDSVNETTSMAQSLAASALPWVLANDVAGLQEAVRAFHAYPEFGYAMVISPTGKVLAHSDPTKVGLYATDEQSLALIKAPHDNRLMEDSESTLDVAVPIEIGERHVGWARVGLEKKGNADNLRKMIWNNAIFLLFATAFSYIAAMLIANRLGRRIGSLVLVAEDVQAGNFDTRVSIPSGEDEITKLGISLNKMLDTLSQNEIDLRKASLYTRSLIEASVDPLVTISAEGKITDVNEATEKVTGRSRAELIGTDFSDYFTEPEKAQEGYQQVFARGSVTDYPLTLRHRDDHTTEVLYNASVYRTGAGKVLGVFAAVRDVTERNKTEAALRESEALFQAVLKILPVGLWVADATGKLIFGNDKGKQIWAGEKYVSIEQYSEYKGWWLDSGKPLGAHDWAMARAVEKGEISIEEEIEIECFDGTHKIILNSALPLRKSDGSISGAIGINQDITERKRAEKALQLSEEGLKEAQRIAHLGSWHMDVATNQVVWSEELYKMYGFDPALPPPLYTESMKLFTPESWERLSTSIAQATGAGIPYEIELETVKKDGSRGWMWARGEPVHDAHGTVVRVRGVVMDITERKMAEGVLREKEERLALATFINGVGVWDWNLRTKEMIWDDSMYALYHMRREDFIGTEEAWRKSLHPDDLARGDKEVADAIAGIKPFDTEFRVVWPNGEIHYIKAVAKVFRDEQGTPLRMLGTNLDITARKMAEEALRKSESRFRLLVESSPMCIHEIGMDGRISSMNKAGLVMMGIEEERKVQGFLYLDAVADTDRERIKELLTKAYAGETSYFEFKASGSGEQIYKSCFVPIKNPNGGVEKLMGITEDITEIKNTELQLQASEQLFRTLAENSPDVIVRYDREGRRIYVNPEFERVNHLSMQQVKGKTPLELSTELKPKADVFTEKLMSAMASGSADKVDLSWIKDDKLICWFVRVVPEFDANGKVVSALTIWSDITERKRAEEEVRRLNAELEQRVAERTAELESFSYSVSHDLRVPLRAIDGFSRILLEEYDEKLDDEGKRLLSVVRDNTSRMARLIDDILAFSRLGRKEMASQEVSMEDLVKEAAAELETSWTGRDVKLELGILPPTHGDAAMLRQIWVNLLSNAVKFTRTKATAVIGIGGHTEGNEAVYYVKDNGVGFDMKYADKLFGVFQRLHGAEEFEGTGAGLAIVKRIVTRHGGRVWAEGKVNEGATIYFALPAKEKDHG